MSGEYWDGKQPSILSVTVKRDEDHIRRETGAEQPIYELPVLKSRREASRLCNVGMAVARSLWDSSSIIYPEQLLKACCNN